MSKTQILNAFLATLAGAALTLATLPAHAQGQPCGKRADLVTRLSAKFGETRRGIGLGRADKIVEVFASDRTGSWTITVTMPDGRMCLLASGQAWEDRMDDLAHLADVDS